MTCHSKVATESVNALTESDSVPEDAFIGIAKAILPRLQQFRDTTKSTPAHLSSHKVWLEEIDDIIKAFKILASEERYSEHREGDRHIIQWGLYKFAEHFTNLWD